jgi:hypothetical protein
MPGSVDIALDMMNVNKVREPFSVGSVVYQIKTMERRSREISEPQRLPGIYDYSLVTSNERERDQ